VCVPNPNRKRIPKPSPTNTKPETAKHPAFYLLTIWHSDNYIAIPHPALELIPANLHRLRQLLSSTPAPQLPLTIPAPSLVQITYPPDRAQIIFIPAIRHWVWLKV